MDCSELGTAPDDLSRGASKKLEISALGHSHFASYYFDMKGKVKEYKYLLRLPRQDERKVAQLVKESGQSTHSVLLLCIRKGMPLVRQALCENAGRVTTVDPLPEQVLERIYAQKNELEGITAEQLLRFQSQAEPE